MNLAAYLDSTNLRADADRKEIILLCEEAIHYGMAAVCIHPYRVSTAREVLKDSRVKICTVIGFPLGADNLEVKLYSARQALKKGAQELDAVINLGALKDRDGAVIEREIAGLVSLKRDYPYTLKIIVETALLTPEELIMLTRMISASGADYIKTSTGFSSRGVSLQDIAIINKHKAPHLKIKAAGGIRQLEFALQLIAAGAHRLGSSSAKKLLEDWERTVEDRESGMPTSDLSGKKC